MRWLLVGLVALAIGACGDDESSNGPTTAEREACFSVRDLEAEIASETRTQEDVAPRVEAVVERANRTENAGLIRESRAMREAWRAFLEASSDFNADEYESFTASYEGLVSECDELGVPIRL